MSPPHPDTPGAVPALATIAGGALLLCALGVLIAQAWIWSAVPDEGDWRLAADALKARHEPGDAFRVEPEWDSRPRVHLQAYEYVPAADATWFDVAPYRRIWILAERGREADVSAHMPEGWSLGEPEIFGTVSLWLASRPSPEATRWDVLSALKDASVRREYGDRVEPCERYEGGDWPAWRCRRRDPFMFVGETLQTVTNDTHRCLWAMPIDRGGRLIIEFPEVPRGARLQGHYGQPIDAVRSGRGAPVSFEVSVDGSRVHHKTFGLHEEGFQPWSASMPEGAEGVASVRFVVSAASQVDRFFCFTARVVAP